MSQEQTNLLLGLLIGAGITIYALVKLTEIAKTLKQIRDKMPDKNESK